MEMYLDERIDSERRERRAEGMCHRLPALRHWLSHCRETGDKTLQFALRNWIDDVSRRIKRDRPRHLKIPLLFQEALGLKTQNVLLEDGDHLWTAVDGGKVSLLYPLPS